MIDQTTIAARFNCGINTENKKTKLLLQGIVGLHMEKLQYWKGRRVVILSVRHGVNQLLGPITFKPLELF